MTMRGFFLPAKIVLQAAVVPPMQRFILTSSKMEKYCCSFEDVKSAMKDIKNLIHHTPLLTCSSIDAFAGRQLFFKTENFQKTGSFKIRGATNAVIKLQNKNEKLSAVVTHSSGNHGQALAKAAQVLGVPCFIIMPDSSIQCKIDAVRGYGATVVTCESTQEARAKVANQIIEKYKGTLVHPSENPLIIAGQGTMAMEILEQNPDIDAIVVPVGGGGMISGIAIAAKHLKPSIKIIGAEPELANDCYLSKLNGELTPLTYYPTTMADGVRVNIGQNTWPIIRDFVDEVITVSEKEIKAATKLIWQRAKLVIEPTSGVGVAAVISDKFVFVKASKVAIVLCGGNVDLDKISDIIKDV